jgi:DNA-binding response OmpR family regulator
MKTIALHLSDPVLTELVAEQLSRLPRIEVNTDDPDLVIADAPTDIDAPHLILGGKTTGGAQFMPIPLRLGELNDRVLYMLSGRDRFAGEAAVNIAPFILTPDDNILEDDEGRSVRLTDKEKMILMALASATDKKLDRRELLQQVWGYADTAETHTLETHLYRLRQKIEESFGIGDIITTRDGVYYLKD